MGRVKLMNLQTAHDTIDDLIEYLVTTGKERTPEINRAVFLLEDTQMLLREYSNRLQNNPQIIRKAKNNYE